MPSGASCGLDLCIVPDIYNALKVANESRYEFICIPLFHPRFKREFTNKCKASTGPITRSDMILPSNDWGSVIVGKLSPYLDVDSPVESIRRESEEAMEQELNYAVHLGLPAVIISLQSSRVANLAHLIYDKVLNNMSVNLNNVWVHVATTSPAAQGNMWRSDLEETLPGSLEDSTWEWWNSFRCLCNYEKRIGIILEVLSDLPEQGELDRWLGEPLRCVLLSTSVFLTNKKGFPVLSRAHQAFIKSLVHHHVQVVIKGPGRHDNLAHYQQYIAHLWQEGNYQVDPINDFSRGFEDTLQCPLQPLMNNLESHTYEIFEKDPVKYVEYLRAIYHALLDRISMEEKATKVATVMVVGAGRGPLVRAALKAAANADRKVKVYAVEKNPNAVNTLQTLKEEVWGGDVTVVSCDMREFTPPEKADILVSELLGSFGDNELSPECLDGAQKFLKDDGISIPAVYTSYICPVQSSKLYNEVLQCRDKDKPPMTHFETPYVVFQQNKYLLSKAQPLFTFEHPNRATPIQNSRYKSLTFRVEQNSVLHGFTGFFDTVLYKDVNLSIVPDTYSQGMFSWFPIFFPLSVPVQLKKGDDIELHFWRCVSKTNVWYEWTIVKPIALSIHNPGGRSYKIGL